MSRGVLNGYGAHAPVRYASSEDGVRPNPPSLERMPNHRPLGPADFPEYSPLTPKDFPKPANLTFPDLEKPVMPKPPSSAACGYL